MSRVRRALISVSDKRGVVELARSLAGLISIIPGAFETLLKFRHSEAQQRGGNYEIR